MNEIRNTKLCSFCQLSFSSGRYEFEIYVPKPSAQKISLNSNCGIDDQP